MRNTRVSGHALPNEGRIYEGGYRVYVGPAVCSCGQPSPEFTSDNARRVWHAQHKTEATGESR